METDDLNKWIDTLRVNTTGKMQEEKPSPRRDSRKKSGVINKNKPRNIKNAEGKNTDSFYYVEMGNLDYGRPQVSLNLRSQAGDNEGTLTGFDNLDFPHQFTPNINPNNFQSNESSPVFSRVRNSPQIFQKQSHVSEKSRKSPKHHRSSQKHYSHKTDQIRQPENLSNIDHVNFTAKDDTNSRRNPNTTHDTKSTPNFPIFDKIYLNTEDTAPLNTRGKENNPKPLDRRTGASPLHRRFNLLNTNKPVVDKLPKHILDALESADRPDILNAYDVMKEGETLLMVEHTRWVTRTVNTDCCATNDMMHVTYERRRCWLPSRMRCGRMKGTFDIRDVLMARAGKQGLLRCIDADLPEMRCFSVVFKDSSRKTLYFVATSEESAKYWVKGINFIKKKLETLPQRLRQELSLWEIFKRADKNIDGQLSYPEVSEMFRKSRVPMMHNMAEIFKKHVNGKHNFLDFERFVKFYQEVTTRSEIYEIFQKYSADGKILTARELYKFIQDQSGNSKESQQEYDIIENDCLEIIEEYEMNEDYRNNKQISVHGFTTFIDSPYCDVFNRRHDEVYQDMKHPMSHYFIASSHNTYLAADQLKGPSSTDAYMNALLQGCRCVELDCWDGPDDDPIIYHGYTLTSKIKFKDAIEVIGKYAFEVSQYPLILSIENHCSVTQQEKMADYMRKIFGTELLTECVIPEHEECHLPSPAVLLGKILIKGKKLPLPASHNDGESSSDSSDSSDDDVSEEDEAAEMERIITGRNIRMKPQTRPAQRFFNRKAATTPSDIIRRGCDESVKQLLGTNCLDTDQRFSLATPSVSNQSSTRTQEQEKKLKLSKYLSDQVVYCKSTKFKGVDHGIQHTCFKEISSFTENKASKLSAHERDGAINLHVEHLNRTYPGATRTDSSNYDPQPLWNAGFQVIALNYQTKCDEMLLYHGKFRQNGRSGYILKPEFMRSLRDDVIQFSNVETTKQIKILVISGHRISVGRHKEEVSLQVEISVSGDPSDVAKRRTSMVKSNGYNPLWNEELEFEVQISSLAMVWFVVRDEDADKVGQFVLPFDSISEGYRTVHVLDRSGMMTKYASLLLRITINDIIE